MRSQIPVPPRFPASTGARQTPTFLGSCHWFPCQLAFGSDKSASPNVRICRHRSSAVEHSLGKGEVKGSNPFGGFPEGRSGSPRPSPRVVTRCHPTHYSPMEPAVCRADSALARDSRLLPHRKPAARKTPRPTRDWQPRGGRLSQHGKRCKPGGGVMGATPQVGQVGFPFDPCGA